MNAYEVKDLKFKYPKNKEDTIKGISFDVKEGEIFGFLGKSGAGKSTTQKILIKLLDNYKGTIKYNGKDLSTLDSSYYEEIGVGFELPVSFTKLTALENIDYFKSLYKNSADTDELLKQVGLWDDRKKKVSEYSKGMKMRLNFVRAMLNNPKVLFLDESTNGLDPHNASIIKALVKDFASKGGTVFITTHLMNDVEEICDRVAFIVDGELKEISTPRELKIKYGKKEVVVESTDGKDEVFKLEDLGSNNKFIEFIKNNEIETIHSGETTLDKIFIEVTGVSLDE